MSLTSKQLESHNSRQRRSSGAGNLAPSTSFGRSPSDRSASKRDGESDTASLRESQSQASAASPRSTRSKSVAPNVDGESVKVVCRVRPFGKRELDLQDDMNASKANEWEKLPLRSVIDMVGGKTTNFLDHEKEYGLRQSFDFDHSLWSVDAAQQESANPTAGQSDVYDIIGKPAVENVWSGFNTCVFAYGQTGSGKTYTMMGSEDTPGLIPRICRELFDELQRKQAEPAPEPGTTREFKLEAKFLEIYNEKVKDLLWALREENLDESTNVDRENLKIRLIPGQGPQVVGLTNVVVKTAEDCMRLIEEGTSNRSVAATKMNEQSSRSHSIFRLTLTQTTTVLPQKQFEKPKHYHRTSTVSLVDLAGSERNKKTGAEGERLKEAVAINKSLTTLKNVIDALVEQRQVIPYRDSTLTWLLSDNLGGNSKTFMIACVSPHLDNAEESLNTLRYAMRTQSVKTFAHVNESDELRRMARMREDMDKMKAKLMDTGEDALRARSDELAASVKTKEAERTKQLQLVDVLNDALSRAKELQYNAAYANRFNIGFNRHAENGLRFASARLKQDIDLLELEVDRLKKYAVQEEGDRDTAAIEERISRERREGLEKDHAELAAKLADLKAKTDALLEADQKLSDREEAKAPTVKAALNLAHVLVARQWHLSALETDRDSVRRNEEVDAERAKQSRLTSEAEADATKRVTDAQTRQDELREAIERAREQQAKTTEELAVKARKLHSGCIFWENENRTVVSHGDAEVTAVGRDALTKQQSEEEQWKAKIQEVHAREGTTYNAARDEALGKLHRAQGEHDAEVSQVQAAAEKTIASIERTASDNTAKLETDYENRIALLKDLNIDSENYVKNAKFVAPRYQPLFSDLSTQLARRIADGDPADLATAIQCMKAVQVERRRTATPLAYRSADSDGESTIGGMTPRSRSAAPSEAGGVAPSTASTGGARRGPSAAPSEGGASAAPRGSKPTTPSRGQSRTTSAMPSRSGSVALGYGSTVNAADIGHIKSLDPPKRLVAQPTRTSLMRSTMQNYRKVPTVPPRGSVPRPRPASARVPSVSPSRVASASPGGPANSAARAEHRFLAKQPDADDLPLPLSDSLHTTGTAERSGAPVDGTRPLGMLRTADGTVLFSRSRSPARTTTRTPPPGERDVTPRRSTTPTRAWR